MALWSDPPSLASGTLDWQGIVSAGIFVGSALVTQWCAWPRLRALLRCLQVGDADGADDHPGEDGVCDPFAAVPHLPLPPGAPHYPPFRVELEGEEAPSYAHRRLEDRLSFHEDDGGRYPALHLPPSVVPPPCARTFRTSTPAPIADSDDTNEEPAGDDDFYPKNANWSHFDLTELWRHHEGRNQDPRNEPPVSAAPTRRQASLEGDRDFPPPPVVNGNCEAFHLSAQFVWTEAAVHHHNPIRGAPDPISTRKDRPTSSSRRPQGNSAPSVPKNPLNRAESLDDRTVWGQHVDSQDTLQLPTALPFAHSTNTSAEASTRLAPSAQSSQVGPTNRSGSPPHPPPPGRSRSTSDLTAPSIREYDRDLAASVRRQNAKARAKYNARIMPHAVILVRHGQSLGNINEDLYATVPDNAMPLTKLGWEQAKAAGRTLRKLLRDKNQSPHFIVSPYVRTVETFHGMASAWCDPADFKHIADRDARLAAWYSRLLALGLTWHEDPRIREQDFGNYQNASVIRQAKRDRHRFGAFYYRFPHGESASDVFDRISTFLDSLWRSFDVHRSRVYVLVTHGIAIRVLLARYFRYTIAQFGMLANPRNGEMVVLRHDGNGRLRLAGRYELELRLNADDKEGSDPNCETRVVGVSFHEKLKVLPPEYVRKVPIRISYDDEDNF